MADSSKLKELLNLGAAVKAGGDGDNTTSRKNGQMNSNTSVFSSSGSVADANQALQNTLDISGSVSSSLSGMSDGDDLSNILQTKQVIELTGDDTVDSIPIFAKTVVVNASLASGLAASSSNKVRCTTVVNYEWDQQYYMGDLVTVNNTYIAYVVKGKSGIVIRVLNRRTSARALLKDFVGHVSDLSFAHITSNLLGCVDERANIYIWQVADDSSGKILSDVKLRVTRADSSLMCEAHRLVWCPCIQDSGSDTSVSSNQLDDSSRLLTVTSNEKVEVWDIDAVISEYGNTVCASDVTHGYTIIVGHSKPITDASLSPDGQVLATASLDGYVRFWQVSAETNEQTRCLHYWKPHSGDPVFSIMFCDNHKQQDTSLAFWRFLITGANYNRELKVWCTVTWKCLQTLTFCPEPTGGIDPCLKVRMDISANFIIASDYKRTVIYVLMLYQNNESGECHLSSLTELLLTSPLLSYNIVDAAILNPYQRIILEAEPDTYPDFIDCNGSVVTLKICGIHTRSLQELQIRYKPDASLLPPGASISSSSEDDIALLRDRLSDLSVDTSVLSENGGTEKHGLPTIPSLQSQFFLDQPKLLTPDAFKISTSTPFSAPRHPQRPVSPGMAAAAARSTSLSTCSSLTHVTGLSSPGDMLGNVVAQSADTTPTLTPQSSQMSPGSVRDLSAGFLQQSGSFNEVHTPPCQGGVNTETHGVVEELKKSQSPSSIEVSDIFRQPQEQIDTGADNPDSPSEHVHDENSPPRMNPPSPVTDSTHHEPITISPVNDVILIKDLPQPQPITSLAADDNGNPATDDDVRGNGPYGGEFAVTALLKCDLNELKQQCQFQQNTLNTLNQKLNTLLDSQASAASVSDLTDQFRTMNTTLNNHITDTLHKHNSSQSEKLETFFKEQQSSDKQRHDRLTNTVTHTINSAVTGKLEKALKNEIKTSILPCIKTSLDPVKDQLVTTAAQRLTATDSLIKENISKLIKSKNTVEAIGHAAATALQTPISTTYRDAFQNIVIPAFDRSFQNLTQQMNKTFHQGTTQYVEQLEQHLSELRKHHEERRDPMLDQLKKSVEQIQASHDQLTNRLNSIHSDVKNMETSMVHGIRKVIQDELKSAMLEQRREISDRIVTAVRSRATTPVPQSPRPDPQQQQQHILQLIHRKEYNAAFQTALTAAELSLVVFVCDVLSPKEVFSNNTCPLEQPVLLSLIQQLSADLDNNPKLKHEYLYEALLNLDTSNPVSRGHVPGVLGSLINQLTVYIQNHPGTNICLRMNMLKRCAQSFIK